MAAENTTGPYDVAIAELETRISALQTTLDTLRELRVQGTGGGSTVAFSGITSPEILWTSRMTRFFR